jgi:lipid II:glycine glycyltransferase (peptidoglycan interpeptide bridge formation enzyme)
MRISPLTSDRFKEYSAIAKDYGSVFNDLKWLSNFDDKIKIFTINNNDRIVGGFFIYTESVVGVKYVKCPPFTPTNGLFVIDNAKNNSKVSSDRKKIITEIADFYRINGFGILRISFPYLFTDFQPFIWRKYKVIPNYTYILDLTNTEVNIFSSFSPEKRNEIRKSEKDNIIVTQVKDNMVIFRMIEQTFKRNKVKFNNEVLKKILFEFSNSENSFAYIANDGEDILAFSYCVHDKQSAYYMFGGSSYENRHSGAGSSTLFECIKKAKLLGLKKFDFEGSMVPYIEHYFRGFGGTLTPYFTVNKANVLLELILKFIRREYF